MHKVRTLSEGMGSSCADVFSAICRKTWTLALQATRNGIRVSDLRDYEVFADKLRKLALDGAKRFEGFDYDVEADLEAYLKIIPRVLPLITDTVPTAALLIFGIRP